MPNVATTTPNWPMIVLYAAIFTLLGGALFWKLGTLLPGYSQGELHAYHGFAGLKALLDNPINAPYVLAVKGLNYLIHDNLITTRLVSAASGVIVLGSFAVLLRRWHGKWTAVFGTLLFGLSAWFLHIARLGTPEVLLFGIFVLSVCGFWLRKTNSSWALVCCFILSACLLYTPGMIWFIGLGLLWQWKTIDAIFKKHLVLVTIGALLFVVALIPLGWAIFVHHHLAMTLLGLPANWLSPLAMAENILKVPFHLFVRNEATPATWLGTAPILDVFSLTMFILGGYTYIKKARLLRTRLFLSLFILTGALMAIGSVITFTVILPFVYLIIAAGVSRLIDLWIDVFPRNPIAKVVGWSAVSLVVVLACSFQVTHYFIGFPHANTTKEVFSVQKP